jgi:hypothetical protein
MALDDHSKRNLNTRATPRAGEVSPFPPHRLARHPLVSLPSTCLAAFLAITTPCPAAAQLDAPRPPTQKPQPPSGLFAAPAAVAAPTLALKARFHLGRKGDVTTLSPLAPIVASLQEPDGAVTIRIEKTTGPLLTVTGPASRPGSARIRIQEALVERANLRFAVENIEADATLGEDDTAVGATSMRLRPLNLPYWNQPVDLLARAAIDAGALTFDGTTTSAAGRIVATFDGNAQMREATGEVQFALERIAFVPGGLQPNELVPALGDSLTAVRGTVAASGTARWSGGEPALSGRLSLRNLSFAVGDVGVENLTGTIMFNRLWPPQTPRGQVLTVGRIDPGMEVTDGTLRFQFDDRSRLRVEHAAISFSGGRLSVEPVTLDPQADHHDLVFRAEGLDLQEALDAANVEAARASGSVSGRIPVSLSRRGIAVNGATLAADTQGVLRYQPEVPPGALQQEDGAVKLLRDALKNFRYDRFTITLDGGSSQEWHSTVHLAGNNPDVLEGHPFVLNVNLTVVPGEAFVELGAERLHVSDTLPLYNALFGLGFLEWLGNRLASIDALMPNPGN